jgi:hypothetical protein
MRDALAIAGRWIVGAVAGLAMLLIAGCGNWPVKCPHGVDSIRTDSGPHYICRPEATK